MNFTQILSWIVNLGIVPNGWLTKLSGWLAVITAVACMSGHPIRFLPCDAVMTVPAQTATYGASAVPEAQTSTSFPLGIVLLPVGLGLIGMGRRVVTDKGSLSYAKPLYRQSS